VAAFAAIERAEPDVVCGTLRYFIANPVFIRPFANRFHDFAQRFRALLVSNGVFHLVEAHGVRAGEYLVTPAHMLAAGKQLGKKADAPGLQAGKGDARAAVSFDAAKGKSYDARAGFARACSFSAAAGAQSRAFASGLMSDLQTARYWNTETRRIFEEMGGALGSAPA